MTGEWEMLEALAREHVSLCRAHNYRLPECRGLYLQAMLAAAPDHEAAALSGHALAVPGADRWPFDRARIQFAFGERLRRMKATAGARAQLTPALDAFQRLGAAPWAARAGGELRATGLTIGQPAGNGPAWLTPQQREIATLAAAGLTDKQIAERLYLSPRTVATTCTRCSPSWLSPPVPRCATR